MAAGKGRSGAAIVGGTGCGGGGGGGGYGSDEAAAVGLWGGPGPQRAGRCRAEDGGVAGGWRQCTPAEGGTGPRRVRLALWGSAGIRGRTPAGCGRAEEVWERLVCVGS